MLKFFKTHFCLKKHTHTVHRWIQMNNFSVQLLQNSKDQKTKPVQALKTYLITKNHICNCYFSVSLHHNSVLVYQTR